MRTTSSACQELTSPAVEKSGSLSTHLVMIDGK